MNGTPTARYVSRWLRSMKRTFEPCAAPKTSDAYAHARVSPSDRAQLDCSAPRNAISSAMATCSKRPTPTAAASGYPAALFNSRPKITGRLPALLVSIP